ncbi:uncharacterized protein LOC105391412 [Plutella xylostella]|uniref:uncharacterized protein LOC105391412 n=1 Tax=Plutella xylostella TaxID=51655 RepID=UPI002032D797|nr:uncharacterized protein LOC105391412 [Plutella xylostella]
MLPSMPVLFARDSQDAFGNKIEPSTSFFGQNILSKPIFKPAPPAAAPAPAPCLPPPPPPPPKVTPKETKAKGGKKKEPVPLEPPKILDEAAREAALVAAYYNKVQSRFASTNRVPNVKFVQFRDILQGFDPSKETPIDLYKKIEEFFGDEHRELSDEFLMFLTTGQAAEAGRLLDRCMMVQLSKFVEMLQTTFARKPAMLRKILRAVTASLACGSVQEMRAKVLPHLRSSPQLGLMFKSLFPDERPPESVYECGTDMLSESFLTEDSGRDTWSLDEPPGDPRRCAVPGVDSVYLQGRVFLQHGRNLRPARVSFPYSKEPYRAHAHRLAPHAPLSPPPSDDEATKKPPKRIRKPKTPKTIKDVNDNTKVTDSPKAKKTQRKQTKKEDKKKDKKEEASKSKQAKIETATEAKEVKSNWTREEDKTMLQVIKGEKVTSQVFARINELLPHRSVTEIKERFFHVMSLLQQMAVGEVT